MRFLLGPAAAQRTAVATQRGNRLLDGDRGRERRVRRDRDGPGDPGPGMPFSR